ncbi:hypothetical protein SETIT_2G265500v2 [Setaria italica]|uniref:Uncharacterized protein n=1 Tax=Setaria italica TaxID=4555 RepID=K3ZXP7_SETIT|nr:hypothetical protein SETIT_2G265500v2 [Setaria italica]
MRASLLGGGGSLPRGSCGRPRRQGRARWGGRRQWCVRPAPAGPDRVAEATRALMAGAAGRRWELRRLGASTDGRSRGQAAQASAPGAAAGAGDDGKAVGRCGTAARGETRPRRGRGCGITGSYGQLSFLIPKIIFASGLSKYPPLRPAFFVNS